MGVWIETLWESKNTNVLKVTPCWGVWIETDISARSVRATEGVWIETLAAYASTNSVKSHPAWVCGLKHFGNEHHQYIPGHTLRGCVD